MADKATATTKQPQVKKVGSFPRDEDGNIVQGARAFVTPWEADIDTLHARLDAPVVRSKDPTATASKLREKYRGNRAEIVVLEGPEALAPGNINGDEPGAPLHPDEEPEDAPPPEDLGPVPDREPETPGDPEGEILAPSPDDELTITYADLKEHFHRAALAWDAPEDIAGPAARDAARALAEMHVQQATGWTDEPDVPGAPDPDPIPLDVLPSVLQEQARAVARSVQVSADMTVALSLVAVSATVAGKAVIRVDGAWDREWLALYAVVIAPPAERKSPVYRHMVAPIRRWEAERQEEVAPRVRAAEDVVEVRERELKKSKKNATGNDGLDAVESARLALEEARREVPVFPELLAQDSTPEALVRQMAQNGGRVAVFSPEGGPLRILDGRYSDGDARLEELTQAYDGEDLHSRRISRDDEHVRGPALTLGVALQPSVLRSIRNARSMRGQGVFGRIVWVLPPSRVGERIDSSEAPPLDKHAERRYADVLRRLLDWGPRDSEKDGTPIPHRLRLSEAATAAKKAYHYEVEEELSPGGSLRPAQGWGGKLVGRAVRIAALLELAQRAADDRPLAEEPISGWAMESAIRLCRALATHTLAVYGELEMDPRTADLRYLLDKLREFPPDVTQSELRARTRGRATIDGADDIADLLDELEERGCVRRVEQSSSGAGAPNSPIVQLHPVLRKGTRGEEAEDDEAEAII